MDAWMDRQADAQTVRPIARPVPAHIRPPSLHPMLVLSIGSQTGTQAGERTVGQAGMYMHARVRAWMRKAADDEREQSFHPGWMGEWMCEHVDVWMGKGAHNEPRAGPFIPAGAANV
eukprot:154258-Chlamydomonas_euryale.AAC.1